ncbi:MAG: SDR family NAD(P)-dependent oxidoreductase, partial [Chloroflexota bacterium]|nr:SDR family NAD(P)-dependent oxidoreductase [Chloroflexota bacterium]
MPVNDDFTGKVAIVTGGGQGMGRAVAQHFAEAGANVVVNDKNADAAARVADSLGDAALAAPGDVTVKADVDRVVASAADTYGSIDILVNNAGILFSTTLADMEEDEWDVVIDVNMKGTYLFSRAVLPYMKQ